ncbi:unnamed protein product [Mytilus edulis]|uniref:Serpin domain-containing protein n=1 Tax=Mytilus edulis TaxID=6550 RepID=A0A8S3VCP8_MYTED|nr:unnamed protein product [Mytilus edulis]
MSTLADIPEDFEQSFIEFSTSLYQGLDKTESVCLSPYSITAALLLVMIGASGRSKEQISSALFQNSLYSEEQQLKFNKLLHSQLTQKAGVHVSFASANRLFFKLQSNFDSIKELPKLGVKDIFDQAKANFSNLIVEKGEGLYVNVAVHKAVFNVNEVGVEGAATTVIGFSLRSVTLQFKAN